MKLRLLREVVIISAWLLAGALAGTPLTSPARGASTNTRHKSSARPQAASSTTSSSKSSTKKKKSRRHHSRREVGQKAPTPDRIKEIQSTLARDGFYQGDPSGKLDSNTVAALQKFQTQHGLDPSGKLDAPTLQKMGLGSDIAGVSAPKPATPPSCCSTSGAGTAAGSATLSSPTHSGLSPSTSSPGGLQASATSSTPPAADPKSSAASTPTARGSAPASSSSSSTSPSSPR